MGKDGERTILDALAQLGYKPPNKNDLEQTNRRLTFVEPMEVEIQVSETIVFCMFKILSRTSLVVQWIRIHLPMQGTRV